MTELEQLKKENAALQAKIDSLMLEYCPDEMTSDQLANWESHQQSIPDTVEFVKAVNSITKCAGNCSSCKCQ